MKVKVLWSILVLSLLILLGACAPAAAPEAPPLVGCKAEITDISLLPNVSPLVGKAGSDLLGIKMVFTISNSNPYQVSVDSLTCNLDTGEGIVIYEQMPYRYFIPAGEEITLQAAGSQLFMDIFMEYYMNEGLAKAQAGGVAAAVWKGLGGVRPAIIPQEAWDMLPAKPVTYSFETTLYTRAQGMQAWESVKGEWQPAE